MAAVISGMANKTLEQAKEKKERLCLPSLAACIKERSPVLKGRAPPHRPRGRASTEVYSSK
eukprot:1156419-Pelagomonas_calceolata.AAC.4